MIEAVCVLVLAASFLKIGTLAQNELDMIENK